MVVLKFPFSYIMYVIAIPVISPVFTLCKFKDKPSYLQFSSKKHVIKIETETKENLLEFTA